MNKPQQDLSRVILYNPELFSRDELVRQFVVRTALLDRLVNEVPDTVEPGSGQHQLISGQRGMGKSTLLRRIQVAINEDPVRSQLWLPLTFPEEQYNVDQPADLWLNCLDALGDYLERTGNESGAEAIDATVQLLHALPKAQQDQAALAELLTASDRLQRGFILLIDNLDMVLKRLKDHHWPLRETLSHERRLLLIGATASDIKELYDYDEAFYDFLKIHRLNGLTHDETVTLLTALGEATGLTEVVPRLQADPGRLETLRVLTGGVPRIIAALFQVLATHSDSTIREDLEELLDKFTPYYKDRIEDLPEQAQQVFHAVATAWDPTSAAEVAVSAGLPSTGHAAAQLKRLSQAGVLDEVPLSLGNDKGYQVSERFFNIWYLFRSSRRNRRRVSWLVEFLKLFYGHKLEETALRLITEERLVGHGFRTAETLIGWASALAPSALARTFAHRAALSVLRKDGTLDPQYPDLLECRSDATYFEEIADRVSALQGAYDSLKLRRIRWGDTNPDDFWHLLGGCPSMTASERCSIARELINYPRSSILNLQHELEAENLALVAKWGSKSIKLLCNSVREGLIDSGCDTEGCSSIIGVDPEVIQSISRSLARERSDPKQVAVQERWSIHQWSLAGKRACWNDNLELSEELLTEATRLAPEYAPAWDWLGFVSYRRGDFKGAQKSLKTSIAIDPSDSSPWDNLGALYYHMRRLVAAEKSFRMAITLDDRDWRVWQNLGLVYSESMRRYPDAGKAFETSLEINPDAAVTWFNFGNLLQHKLSRYDEAELAYRQAIRLAPGCPPWNNLGHLLEEHLARYHEAEQAYKNALTYDSTATLPRNNLARLLRSQFGRLDEAMTLYREVLEIDPDDEQARDEMTGIIRQFALMRIDSGNREQFLSILRKVLEFPQILDADLRDIISHAFVDDLPTNVIALLDESAMSERWRPLRAALVVAAEGSAESLLRLAPEVRKPAEELLQELWPERADEVLAEIHGKRTPRRRRTT